METPKELGKRAFGDPIVGSWVCLKCHYEIFPNPLHKQQDEFQWATGASALKEGYIGPLCPQCKISLEYDEAA